MKLNHATTFFIGVIAGLVLGFLFPTLSPVLGTFVIGGVITQGILGGISGKVGPVVGGKWKETDYLRSYVVPANPNTVGQQAQRARMARAVHIAKQLLTTIILDYWNPFNSSMSGYNAWIKANIKNLADPTLNLQISNLMAQGSLTPVASMNAVYSAGSGDVEMTWPNNAGIGNALGTDVAVGVVAKLDGSQVWVEDNAVTTRADLTTVVSCSAGLNPTSLIAFVFFRRGTGADLIVSNSVGDVAQGA